MDSYEQYQQCLQQNQPEQALHHLQQHLAANRQHALGFYQLGNLLRLMEKFPEALCAYQEACQLDPEPSDFHLNLGVTHQYLQQLDKAISAYKTAWQKNNQPAYRFNLAQALLLAGRYEEGWAEYEWRRRIPEYQPRYEWHPPERQWKGQPFPGQTLLVYHEQGLGDDIQFSRYIPQVKALGGKVILSTRPSLFPILSTVYGLDQIVEHSVEGLTNISLTWAVPIMSLPFLCRTTLDSVPNQMPYLSVPPAYRSKWRALLAPYLPRPGVKNIGFVWACNPEDKQAQVRTCPLSELIHLFTLPNTQWFSIQKGPAATDLQELAATQPNIVDLSHHIDDFADTAAILEQLDLLISIDTSVPHLAGAIGKPAWLLLPFSNEWRWLQRRHDSPWYPDFRLFRQPIPGQWAPMLTRVRQALLSFQPTARP